MPGFQSLGVLAEEGLILKRWNGRAPWFILANVGNVPSFAVEQKIDDEVFPRGS
jgi:hypothetical protein